MTNKNKFLGFLNKRTLKYGTNSVIMIAAVIAIAVVINVLVGMVPLKIDLTPEKLYSLTDVSREILSNLEKDVVIYGLFDEGKIGSGSQYREMIDLLEKYDQYPRVTVEYVDPDKNPGFINSLKTSETMKISAEDFVVKCGNKVKVLSYYDLFNVYFDQQTFSTQTIGSKAEQGFTGAIKYVTSDITPTVYFIEGHEEIALDSDLTTLKTQLENNNYDVKSLNLMTVQEVPEDAEVLIVASPKKDLSIDERKKVEKYLEGGGKAVFMFDYLETSTTFSQFEEIFLKYNVSLNYDRVKENNEDRHVPENPYAILLNVQRNEIIPQAFNVFLANSRSVNILKNEKEYVKTISLMKTSDGAEGEQVDKSRGDNIPGPLDIAVAVEYKGGKNPSKIIVMGNGYFITDSAYGTYGPYYNNGMVFFLNSLNWMLDRKDEVVIPPKNYQVQRLTITAQQANLMAALVVIVLPLLILCSGMFVWMRRRHL